MALVENQEFWIGAVNMVNWYIQQAILAVL